MNKPRPVIRWHGSKWRIAPWVISHFPPHRLYIEPFGGSASVLLHKPRAITEVFNDLDQEIVNMFRVIRDKPQLLAAALALTPYARAEYNDCYLHSEDAIERARRFIARSFMGMNSKGAIRKSGFDARTNADGYTGRLRSLIDLPDQVLAVAERFLHVVIENIPAVDLIGRYSRNDALFYIDPPYLPDTRSGSVYTHEMTLQQHEELLCCLLRTSAMVVISGYHSCLYDQALDGWRRFETTARTDGGIARTEVLWINQRAAEALGSNRPSTQMKMFATEAAE